MNEKECTETTFDVRTENAPRSGNKNSEPRTTDWLST